jgi:outer membrane protein assembly factor BamB
VLVLAAGLGAASCGAAAGAPTTPAVPSSTAPATPLAANEWPMYGQNPSRTCFNAGETALSAASLARLAPRWQVSIGQGPLPPSGTPAVSGGRVFVGSSVTDGDNFFAFDGATGQPLWSANVGPTTGADGGVGIGAGAAVQGGLVVAGGADRAYYGLDAATGEVAWRHDLDAGPSGFAWASPLVAGGRAWVGVSSEGDNPSVRGGVRSLDVATGEVLASQYFVPEGRRGAGIWNSPALSGDGQTLVVATGEDFDGYDGPYNRAMVSMDPTSLQIRQADKQGATDLDLDFGTSPVVFHDAAGRALVGANHKNGVFYAYALGDIASGPVWQRALGVAVGMMPAYDPNVGRGGTLFVVGDNGQLFAVDPATGADRFAPVALGFMHANMALANGLLFASVGGRVFVLDEATGELLRTLDPAIGGRTFSGVAVANGLVYWLSGPYLNAWGLP